MAPALRFLAPALILLALSGCGEAPGAYPSLALRPEEQAGAASTQSPASPASQPDTVDPALAQRLAAIEADARAADARFAAELPAVERLAAAAGAPGGETWVQAQQAISRLEATRSEGTTGLAELDEDAHGVADGRTPSAAALAAIARSQATITALDAEHEAKLKALSDRLDPKP